MKKQVRKQYTLFLNGMVPIIINRKISKEILLVPQAMYSNEYIESLEEDN